MIVYLKCNIKQQLKSEKTFLQYKIDQETTIKSEHILINFGESIKK